MTSRKTQRYLTQEDVHRVEQESHRLLFYSEAVAFTRLSELFPPEQIAAMVQALSRGLAIYRLHGVAAVYRPIVGAHGGLAISVQGSDACYPLGWSEDDHE